MSRLPRPWFRQSKNTWYATINGDKVSLRVSGKDNDGDAWFALFRLLRDDEPTAKPSELTVAQLCQRYLQERQGTVKKETHDTYRYLLLPPLRSYQGKAKDIYPPSAHQSGAQASLER